MEQLEADKVHIEVFDECLTALVTAQVRLRAELDAKESELRITCQQVPVHLSLCAQCTVTHSALGLALVSSWMTVLIPYRRHTKKQTSSSVRHLVPT